MAVIGSESRNLAPTNFLVSKFLCSRVFLTMNRNSILCVVLVGMGCATTHREVVTRSTLPTPSPVLRADVPTPVQQEVSLPVVPPRNVTADPMATLGEAIEHASPGARRVLETTRAMLNEQTVVRGSCYSWTNAVYRRAGGRKQVAFHRNGREPFADSTLLRPGDWVFFINHSYGDVTHSAIFIAWINENTRDALMVSYAGGNRNSPGRFGEYELTNVYQLVRMGDELR
jgi:hypothetical protein